MRPLVRNACRQPFCPANLFARPTFLLGARCPPTRKENPMLTKTSKAVRKQRSVQRKVDADDRNKAKAKPDAAMQAGARLYPEPPFPKQHHPKPGEEGEIKPAPLYDAPFWQGSRKLDGKVALITGGDSGIGRAVAVLFAREGADVAFTYLKEEQSDAKETIAAIENEGRRGLMLKNDVREPKSCQKAVDTTISNFARLDILVNNAAY